jgi:hypothetical protein
LASLRQRPNFNPQQIAKSLMTDAGDLAPTTGLGKAAIQDDVRVRNPETQERLRELVDCGSVPKQDMVQLH